MAAFPIPITLVRWTSKDADQRLHKFVFGGMYAGDRAPRGIDPEFVSHWILQNINANTGAMAIAHVLDLLRFYERTDVLQHLSRLLTRNESNLQALSRSLHVVQCIGEIGTVEQGRAVSTYFEQYLLPRPEAMDAFLLVLDTADSLAATVDVANVGRRLNAAIDAASKVEGIDGPAGIPFRKYNDYAHNNYAVVQRNIEAKRRLSGLTPSQRLQELVVIYLGESPMSVPQMEIFAARLIRAYARDDGRDAVYAAFGQVIDITAKSELPKPRKDFLIHRAGQAIVYLQGKLTFPQEAAFDAVESGPPSFLWDDIG